MPMALNRQIEGKDEEEIEFGTSWRRKYTRGYHMGAQVKKDMTLYLYL